MQSQPYSQAPRSRRWDSLLGLLLLVPLVHSCSFGKGSTKEAVDNKLTAEQQKTLDEARAELEIGRNMAGRLLKFYGAYPDEKLVRYVNEVGLYVAKFSEFPDRRYMFDVYNSETVNAFACPGGYILVSLGAIKTASNEAELAHILGHEVAHVGKKHMFNTLTQMSKDELDKASEEGEKAANLPPELKARQRPDPEESELGALVARYMAGSTAGLNVLKAAKAGMSLILEKGLGAELELEADREGTKYAINAGYTPKALISFLCRLEVERGRPQDYCLKQQEAKLKAENLSVLDRTHPSVPVRVANIKTVLLDLKADEIVGAKGKKRFATMKQRLPQTPGKGKEKDKDKEQEKEKPADQDKSDENALEGKE